jgi:ABC-2 type transport system permease protein
MFSVVKKEVSQFFSSLTGYIAIIVFLLLCGLLLFIIPSNNVLDFNMLDYGYASLEKFFKLAPWVLLLLVPAITMRLLSEEFKTGTFEVLKTKPLTSWQIILGKYFGALGIVFIALVPTIVYVFAIKALSANNGIDLGSTIGSYVGLFFLVSVFVSIGLCCSSFTTNAVAAFIISVLVCMVMYFFFAAISRMEIFKGGIDYYIESIGLDFHYKSISRGVLDTRDLVYFLSAILLFLGITYKSLLKK